MHVGDQTVGRDQCQMSIGLQVEVAVWHWLLEKALWLETKHESDGHRDAS